MSYEERRRVSSRWVRFWSMHGKLAAALLVCGWGLMALADGPAAGVAPQPDAAIETIKLAAGGALLLFGIFAGITVWLINPAIDRKLAAHRKEQALDAHPTYISRVEWELKHTALDTKVDTMQTKILDAIATLKRGRGHE